MNESKSRPVEAIFRSQNGNGASGGLEIANRGAAVLPELKQRFKKGITCGCHTQPICLGLDFRACSRLRSICSELLWLFPE